MYSCLRVLCVFNIMMMVTICCLNIVKQRHRFGRTQVFSSGAWRRGHIIFFSTDSLNIIEDYFRINIAHVVQDERNSTDFIGTHEDVTKIKASSCIVDSLVHSLLVIDIYILINEQSCLDCFRRKMMHEIDVSQTINFEWLAAGRFDIQNLPVRWERHQFDTKSIICATTQVQSGTLGQYNSVLDSDTAACGAISIFSFIIIEYNILRMQ